MAIWFIILSILLSAVNSIKFSFALSPGPKNMLCFNEKVMQDTLVVGEVFHKLPKFTVSVYDPNGQTLFSNHNETRIKFSFTGQLNGSYSICINNFHSEMVTLNFSLLTGIEAKDYSELANKQKIKPMENQIMVLEELLKLIKRTQDLKFSNVEIKIQASDYLSSKLLYSSLITIVLVLVLSFFESYYIKDFFRQKKLI